MAAITKEVAKHHVDILSGHITAVPGEERAYVTFFAYSTEATAGPRELAEALKALDMVVEAEVLEAEVPGLIIDKVHFPPKFLGQDSVVLNIRMVGHMFSRLDEVFGTGASVILYEMSMRAGEVVARGVKAYGLDDLNTLKAIAALGVAAGWGVVVGSQLHQACDKGLWELRVQTHSRQEVEAA